METVNKNQWILGWNAARYGQQKSVEEVKQEPIEWRLGYIAGLRESKLHHSGAECIKRFLAFDKVRLDLN